MRTPSGGFHLYFLIPQGVEIRGGIAVWPGIDILTKGFNVIQPGSHTRIGKYSIDRSFKDYPIPECPKDLIELIQRRHQQTQAQVQNIEPTPRSSPGLSSREWFGLKRNTVFRSMWNLKPKYDDQSPSAREYHLAKAVLCQGLSKDQAYRVIADWRSEHDYWNIKDKPRSRRQIAAIIDGAWKEVASYVTTWKVNQELISQAKRSTSTEGLICRALAGQRPQTPKSIAAMLGIPHERVKKAMLRLHHDEKLVRISRGLYQMKEHSSLQGTNLCITTSSSPITTSSSCSAPAGLEVLVQDEFLIKNPVEPTADGHLKEACLLESIGEVLKPCLVHPTWRREHEFVPLGPAESIWLAA